MATLGVQEDGLVRGFGLSDLRGCDGGDLGGRRGELGPDSNVNFGLEF